MDKFSASLLAQTESSYRMIDVSPKAITTRRALAEGRAAKNTAMLLPLCHPIAIEAVRVVCTLEEQRQAVLVRCEATASAKTGVEMEALVGVQAALLTIYDLCKGTDPNLQIGEISLLEKQGGKSGHWTKSQPLELTEADASVVPLLSHIRTAVITISDRCAAGQASDRSGAWLKDYVVQHGAILCPAQCVPDNLQAIQEAVLESIHSHKAELVITTGGTGLSPRDLTPEAMQLLWEREVPGFGELLRSSGARHTPMAFLSRSGAGMIGRSLVLMLPGSLKAVEQGMDSLLPLLPHAFHIAQGGQHENLALQS
ncbi:MAG: bifunctional molybdenum cofactor biosynthesis protein MoaC/MoaB [Proteobacteria bacterium]|nr:bifunctional molybdenum cofactor biosynthesis protein MoaC/MoaB [Pseudomonadota bacterium]